MSEDLKLIKKLYGEAMMHFCRDFFSSILEEKGLLPKLLQENFASSHILYGDLVTQEMVEDFKNYIYDLFHKEDEKVELLNIPSPEELMSMAGYKLFECKSEEDIQSFKRYYARGETLCTFQGKRLKTCYVFFAVKENVDEITRADFPNPQRQDLYGTSVISIQFSRDKSHILSIKNRYNHSVENPDATFSNNLDNIIEGLTESFEKYYGLKQVYKNDGFEIPGYIRANDGKWYKYNYEINNIYYCPDNIIIDNGKVKKYDKEKFIIMDYFVLDLVEKQIYLYDPQLIDSFPGTIIDIEKIDITKDKEGKIIKITHKGGEISTLTLDRENEIIEFESNILLYQASDYFMISCSALKKVSLPHLVLACNWFLPNAENLNSLELPSLQHVGDYFLTRNRGLRELNLPKLRIAGGSFLPRNEILSVLFAPELERVGSNFLEFNEDLIELDLPELTRIGVCFMRYNKKITRFNLPKLQDTDIMFLNDHPEGESISMEISEREKLKK